MEKRLLDINADRFDPAKTMSLSHSLAGHPLLTIPSLIELSKRMGPQGRIKHQLGNISPGSDFEKSHILHSNQRTPEDTIRNIESCGSWMAFHNIQTDPVYVKLIDEILDQIEPLLARRDPGMYNRQGWIFLASPGSTTPFHIDHEQNFLLQIAGKGKKLYIWDEADRSVLTDRALEIFWAKNSLKEVTYKDEYLAKATEYKLDPGQGVFMPNGSPHMVKNGDEVSITLSVTYHSALTQRRAIIYKGNDFIRNKLKIEPAPLGRSHIRDELKHLTLRGILWAKSMMRKIKGSGPVAQPQQRY